VQAIKAFRGGTTPDARRLFAHAKVPLFEGTAVKIFTKIENLVGEGIKLQVEPQFNYTKSDLMGMNLGLTS
jgi:hypothetical protein